jgi:DNA-binding response OmpR family regulator
MRIKKKKEFKIMIVDDEESIVNFLRASMEDEGFTVLETTHAQEAVDLCRDSRPHLVLLDLRMPGLNGIEVVKKIREWDRENSVLIVLISAYGAEMSEADRNILKELDVKDFIPKNVSLSEAKERIFKVIDTHYRFH